MSRHRVRVRLRPRAIPTLVIGGVLVWCSLLAEAMANGPEVGRDAGMIFPVASDSVQLVSERVVIRVPDDWSKPGRATCHYVLRNLSSARREFEMAFLTNAPFAPTPDGYRVQYEGARFTVTLDGSPLDVRHSPVAAVRWTGLDDMPPDSLPTWRVALRPGATGQLDMSYDVSWSGGSDGGSSSSELTYHARPAALWAGPIREAEIRFELNPLAALILECSPQLGRCFSFSIDPPGYRWLGAGFGWSFKDWEPTTDFSFGYEIHRDEP
jgi:hypothetical protein